MIDNTPTTLKTNKRFIYFPEVSNAQWGRVAELRSLLISAQSAFVARRGNSLVI